MLFYGRGRQGGVSFDSFQLICKEVKSFSAIGIYPEQDLARTILSVLKFHTRQVLSVPAPTMTPLLMSQHIIEFPLPPRKVAFSNPLDPSHTFTVESLLPVATKSVPSPSYLFASRKKSWL